jgi:hypothetical protein
VNHGPGILAVSWIEGGLALVAVIARMYSRAKILHNIGWDDWTMLFTMVGYSYRTQSKETNFLTAPYLHLHRIRDFGDVLWRR